MNQAVVFTHAEAPRLHIELFDDTNPQDIIQLPFTANEVVALSSVPAFPRSRTLSRTLPYTFNNGGIWTTTNLRYSWMPFYPTEVASSDLQSGGDVMSFFVSDPNAAAAESTYLVKSFPVDVEMFVNSGRFRLDGWATSDVPFEGIGQFWCMGSVLFYCEDR